MSELEWEELARYLVLGGREWREVRRWSIVLGRFFKVFILVGR